MSVRARIAVEITTFNGVYRRSGQPATFADNTAQVQQGLLGYPDIRCTTIILYVEDNAKFGTYLEHSRHATNKSLANNLAFATLDPKAPWYIPENTIDLTVLPDNPKRVTEAEFDAWNLEMDHDPNRVIYSDATQPRRFAAKSVIYAGNGRDDRVMAFGANTVDISLGQFGSHPVYILCRHSVTPMAVLDGGGFAPTEPISVSIGCVSRYGVANVGRIVVFASDEGVFALSPELTPISDQLRSFYGSHAEVYDGREPAWAFDSLQNKLGPDTAFGYYSNRDLNVRELWVSTTAGTYAYSMDHGRWFTMSERVRKHFLSVLEEPTAALNLPRLLYSASDNGFIEESARVAPGGAFSDEPYGEQVFVLETSRLNMGFPGEKVRIRRMAIRQRNMCCVIDWQLLEPLNRIEGKNEAAPKSPQVENIGRIVARSGSIKRGNDGDVFNTGSLKVRRPTLRITGVGSPHHSIESFLFIVRPIFRERKQIGNYDQISKDITVVQ